nr:hypothetical protein [uncultured Moraxella sp.]
MTLQVFFIYSFLAVLGLFIGRFLGSFFLAFFTNKPFKVNSKNTNDDKSNEPK